MAALGSATTHRLHGILTGTAVDTVTLSPVDDGIELYNRGDSDIWVTTDGSTPVVNGSNCDIVPAGTTYMLDGKSDSPNVVGLLGNGNAYSLKVM